MEEGFFNRVYEVARQIPYGRVCTYGIIARTIGSPQAARMVGWAMNKSGLEKNLVPAHRVVNRNGLLTGKNYFPNSETMKEMLESEGIKVINNKIQDFEKLLWKPEEMEVLRGKSEEGSSKSEVGRQKAEVGRPKTEG